MTGPGPGRSTAAERHADGDFALVRSCRRGDLNPHALYGHQILSLARLPIPPLRRSVGKVSAGPLHCRNRYELGRPWRASRRTTEALRRTRRRPEAVTVREPGSSAENRDSRRAPSPEERDCRDVGAHGATNLTVAPRGTPEERDCRDVGAHGSKELTVAGTGPDSGRADSTAPTPDRPPSPATPSTGSAGRRASPPGGTAATRRSHRRCRPRSR